MVFTYSNVVSELVLRVLYLYLRRAFTLYSQINTWFHFKEFAENMKKYLNSLLLIGINGTNICIIINCI
jgi:hypothetical protein